MIGSVLNHSCTCNHLRLCHLSCQEDAVRFLSVQECCTIHTQIHMHMVLNFQSFVTRSQVKDKGHAMVEEPLVLGSAPTQESVLCP